jgi:hypothetical protein
MPPTAAPTPNVAILAIAPGIRIPLEAVPRITLAPPSLTSSSTGFCDLLSIYCMAPSFFA